MLSGRAIAAAAVLVAACDGSSGRVDGGGAAGADAGMPAGPVNASLRRVLAGGARLLGNGPSSCSHEDGATGDRWCVFGVRPGEAPGAPAELWVFNATRVIGGAELTCDGSSPLCRRLSTTVWTGPGLQPLYPYDHRFDGDTLIFHADALAGSKDYYQGPMRVWRPGWSEPRVVTSPKGFTCYGHPRAAVVWCLDDVAGLKQFDLLAGAVASGPPARLPFLARVTATQSDGEVAWSAAFSPRGDYFAFSLLEETTQREVLWGGPVATLGTTPPGELVFNASRPRISHDGTKVYFLRDYNYDLDEPRGTLAMADFPSGKNPTTLRQAVGAFDLVPDLGEVDRGVGFFEDLVAGEGTFQVLGDRSRPQQLVTIAREIEFASSSFDGRFTYYPKMNRQGGQEAHIARNDGSGECVLNEDPESLAALTHFMPHAKLVFWSEQREDTDGAFEGWLAQPDGCGGRRKFADRLGVLVSSGDGLVVFGENAEGGAPHAALRYARLGAAGEWPAEGAATIRERADRWVSIVREGAGRGAAHVIFQVDDAPADEQGIYVFGPIPLLAP